jgi:hypothetical protein
MKINYFTVTETVNQQIKITYTDTTGFLLIIKIRAFDLDQQREIT